MRKECPTCHREYSEIECYCTKCGIKLVKAPNRCSAMKTKMCEDKVFGDNDKYCSFCGAPTTYWKDELEELKKW